MRVSISIAQALGSSKGSAVALASYLTMSHEKTITKCNEVHKRKQETMHKNHNTMLAYLSSKTITRITVSGIMVNIR